MSLYRLAEWLSFPLYDSVGECLLALKSSLLMICFPDFTQKFRNNIILLCCRDIFKLVRSLIDIRALLWYFLPLRIESCYKVSKCLQSALSYSVLLSGLFRKTPQVELLGQKHPRVVIFCPYYAPINFTYDLEKQHIRTTALDQPFPVPTARMAGSCLLLVWVIVFVLLYAEYFREVSCE